MGALMVRSRRAIPSSRLETPMMSAPLSMATGAKAAAPWPYASALRTAINFTVAPTNDLSARTLVAKWPVDISAQVGRKYAGTLDLGRGGLELTFGVDKPGAVIQES